MEREDRIEGILTHFERQYRTLFQINWNRIPYDMEQASILDVPEPLIAELLMRA